MKKGDAEEVAEKATKALILLIVANVFDFIQTVFSFILRGLGKQLIGSLVAFINFCVVQISLSILFGIYFELGVFGIWMAESIGCFLCAVSFLVILLKLDFHKIQKEVLARLEKDNNDVSDQSLLTENDETKD
jgi:Na+-driven multidrug efflux pump